jgi:hypothetical protein
MEVGICICCKDLNLRIGGEIFWLKTKLKSDILAPWAVWVVDNMMLLLASYFGWKSLDIVASSFKMTIDKVANIWSTLR